DLVHTGRTYVPETQYRNYAPFLQGRFKLTDKLNLNAGARYEKAKLKVDTYSTIDRTNVVKEPLNNSLRTQRGLKRAAVESCLDGQGGSLS
ncbi:TonB-dependent receptor domain-containing protein, partial [Alcanivorax sp. HI0044]|uniref:TonB-dependent receptor domain-containing protein n=2 Tax=unclassified Alcanivorax TaxID=2638842 RepID=UPI000B117661